MLCVVADYLCRDLAHGTGQERIAGAERKDVELMT